MKDQVSGKMTIDFYYSKASPLCRTVQLLAKTRGVELIKINILKSCPTQGRVEGWDAMKPLYYRSVSSNGAGRPRLTHHHKGWWNETKWMRWVWRNGGMKFVVGEKGEKPTQSPFRPPRNPHGVTETRTRDPSGGRRAPNRLRHELNLKKKSFCDE